uniref:Uncharacterized protein n=1 Tax=Ciona intestinalis TaxID=7719 RepID=H2XRH1_CIOIN
MRLGPYVGLTRAKSPGKCFAVRTDVAYFACSQMGLGGFNGENLLVEVFDLAIVFVDSPDAR